jgi:hypothetical protein
MTVYPPNEQTPYNQSYQPAEINILAIVSLISGILGWLGIFGLGGIVAVITGHMAKGQIATSLDGKPAMGWQPRGWFWATSILPSSCWACAWLG